MSRIGFKPVSIPSGVTFVLKDGVATVKGPKGEVSVRIPSDVSVEVKRRRRSRQTRHYGGG
jgi:Ribosomal protein L6P/L9E